MKNKGKGNRPANRPTGSRPTGRGATVRVKTARGRTVSSQRWLQRQLNDPYVAEAKKRGYRSRAAFKLLQLDDQFHFLKHGGRVIDLGAAPGGWTQVAVERVHPERSPAVVVDSDTHMTSSMRRMMKMMNREGEAMPESKPNLEINPDHAMLVRLNAIRQSDADLAGQVAEQIYDNALVAAGLLEDPRAMLGRLNGLLEKLLNK